MSKCELRAGHDGAHRANLSNGLTRYWINAASRAGRCIADPTPAATKIPAGLSEILVA
jgi:hypothetical protein